MNSMAFDVMIPLRDALVQINHDNDVRVVVLTGAGRGFSSGADHKSAGSVHACALFRLAPSEPQMLLFVEDVGRHNALDTIAGWSALHDVKAPLALYTTGRLTSEMIIKSAQMGVTLVVSRSGITQMGHQIAQQLGLCAIGRATNKHFLCYSAPERLLLQPELAASRLSP
jgi:FdhD protein